LRSNFVFLSTTSSLNSKKFSKNSLRLQVFGLPSTIARVLNPNELSEIIKLSEEFPENISLQWIYAQKIYIYIFAELNNLEDKRTEDS